MAYQYIDREECIGDSLYKINNNSVNFDTRISTLSSQVASSVLFVPVNYSTLSNAVAPLVSWAATGNTNASPWWSGLQTATITAPTNTVGVSINVCVNTACHQNNLQKVYFFNGSEQPSVNPPSTSTTPANITTIQRDAISSNYLKTFLNPTGGSGATWRAEDHNTFHVYLDSNQFKWFWVDDRTNGAPSSNPTYSLDIRVLGYYVKVV
jgi:hypothetical protein